MSTKTEQPMMSAGSQGSSVRSWLWNAATFGFALSIFIHVAGFLLSGFITIGSGTTGGESGTAPPVEMALMTETELLAVVAESGGSESPLVQEVAASAESEVRVEDSEALEGLVGDGPGPSEIGDIGGGGDVSTGDGDLGGGAGSGGARFFGIEATGSRFVYVVDVSGSMEGPRLERLRAELSMSIAELQEGAQFIVIPFATLAAPLGERSGWTEASPTGKRWARNTIAAELARARDGTVPLPGFQIAFVQRPRADAMYFMTDGEQFPAETEEELARLNGQFKIPIHCIRFGDGDIERPGGNPAEKTMKAIAKQSKGTYKFISIK